MFYRMMVSLLISVSLLVGGSVLADSKVYVSNIGNEIRVIDQDSGLQEAIINIAGDISVVRDLHVHPSGDYLLAGFSNTLSGTRQLAVIDTVQNVEIHRVDVPGFNSNGVYSPDGNKIYFISSDVVKVFDLNVMTFTDDLVTDLSGTKSIKLSPDGSRVFVIGRLPNVATWVIRSIDTVTLQTVNETPTDVDSYVIASHPSGNSIFVRHLGELRLMDATTLQLLPQVLPGIPQGGQPFGAWAEPVEVKGDYLIVNDYLNNVDVYDINDYSLLGSVDMTQLAWHWMIGVELDVAAGKFSFAGEGIVDGVVQGQLAIVDATSFTVDNIAFTGLFPIDSAINPAAVDLTLQVQRVDALGIQCTNNTTGQVVNIAPQPGVNLWNCTANGLVINKGDNVTVGVNGNVQ